MKVISQQQLDEVAEEHGWELGIEMGEREYRKGRRAVTLTGDDATYLATVYEPKGDGHGTRYWSTAKIDEVLAELAR